MKNAAATKGGNDNKCTSGLRAVFGCNHKALASFRISIGILLFVELILRYRFLHPFYSDHGTLPTELLLPKIDTLYKIICIHCISGSMVYQQALLTIQVICAACLIMGYRTRLSSILSWYLYLSLTLRNTWLNFILDRYFHYMLFYAMFLPISECWSLDRVIIEREREKKGTGTGTTQNTNVNETIVSLATIALKLQVCWIYLDAGQGKYNDPLGGWTLGADPLPALDTYARHTLVARYLYALLTPTGLRYMTPTVVYVELFAAPIALLGSYIGNRKVVLYTIATICSLHVGIALTVRNTYLLSSVACAAWCVFLPTYSGDDIDGTSASTSASASATRATATATTTKTTETSAPARGQRITSLIATLVPYLIITPMVCGCIWFETMSGECNQSMKHIWSVLLHNRWNVFVGAEEYVTWEIAPGKLADGSVVDVWGRKEYVDWEMPGTGAPCTSTARPGRWRSFPYLAELDGEDGEALWSYLCRQWDEENGVTSSSESSSGKKSNSHRKLLRFNFFMLQADVLPNMGFSSTRKRLIQSYDCTKLVEKQQQRDKEESNTSGTHSEL